MPQTKSQIDRLGERLKQDLLNEENLTALDEYRLKATLGPKRI